MYPLRRVYVLPSSLLATPIRTSSTPYFHGVPFIAARNVVHGRHFRSNSIKLTNTVDLTSLFAQLLHDFAKGKQEMQQMSERFSEEKSRMLREANEEKERKIKEVTEEKERKIKEATMEANEEKERKIKEVTEEKERRIKEATMEANEEKERKIKEITEEKERKIKEVIEEMEKKLEKANEEKERIREKSYEEKESRLRSFYEESIKMNKLLDGQRAARMKAENELLRYEGRLNCRGMLEYIAAEKFPNTRSTTERLRKCVEEQSFVDVLQHVCSHRNARSDDVVKSSRHIYHTLSKHFHGSNDGLDAVTIRESDFASVDVTAILTFLEWADKDYTYVESRDNKQIHRYQCKWYKPPSP